MDVRRHDIGSTTGLTYRHLFRRIRVVSWSSIEPLPIPRERSRVFGNAHSDLRDAGVDRSAVAARVNIPLTELLALTLAAVNAPTRPGTEREDGGPLGPQ